MKNINNRTKKAFLLYAVITLIVFAGCEKDNEKAEPNLDKEFGFNQAEYESVLKNSFSFSDTTDPLYQSIKENLDTLKSFYSQHKFNPIFIKSFASKSFVDSLLTIIAGGWRVWLNT